MPKEGRRAEQPTITSTRVAADDLFRACRDRASVVLPTRRAERGAGAVHSCGSCAGHLPEGGSGASTDMTGCVGILTGMRFVTPAFIATSNDSCLTEVEKREREAS